VAVGDAAPVAAVVGVDVGRALVTVTRALAVAVAQMELTATPAPGLPLPAVCCATDVAIAGMAVRTAVAAAVPDVDAPAVTRALIVGATAEPAPGTLGAACVLWPTDVLTTLVWPPTAAEPTRFAVALAWDLLHATSSGTIANITTITVTSSILRWRFIPHIPSQQTNNSVSGRPLHWMRQSA
jgi:hypothetical protein